MEREYTLEELVAEIERAFSLEFPLDTIRFHLTTIREDSFYQSIDQLPDVFLFNKRRPNGLALDHNGIRFHNELYEWDKVRLTGISYRPEPENSSFCTLIIGFKNGKFKTIALGSDFYAEDTFIDFAAVIQLYKKKHHLLIKNPPKSPKTFTYRIRKASTNDLKQITTLFKDTIQNVSIKDYSPEQIAVWTSSAENRELWTKRLHEQYFLVAENAEEITGFASIDPRGCIDLLYVHKDHQRKGIAEKLLEELEKYAYENKLAEVWADVSIIARPFFAAKGFTIKREYFKFVQGVEFKQAIMIKTLAKK